jgi:hypothetical protein
METSRTLFQQYNKLRRNLQLTTEMASAALKENPRSAGVPLVQLDG